MGMNAVHLTSKGHNHNGNSSTNSNSGSRCPSCNHNRRKDDKTMSAIHLERFRESLEADLAKAKARLELLPWGDDYCMTNGAYKKQQERVASLEAQLTEFIN